jgi:hypothetical protein
MEIERRAAPRHSASIYFNKYIDGQPYIAEILELSQTGMLIRKIHEPDAPRACYAFEVAPAGGDRFFLCGAPVWNSGPFEAIGFVAQSPADRARIEALIGSLALPGRTSAEE